MTLTELHRAVEGAVAAKHIGTPVFVRYLFQTANDADAVPRLTNAVAAVRGWIAQPIDRVYALRTDAGQVSLTLTFSGGATALVSFAHGQPHGSGIDVMVLGNHGALYHEAESDPPGTEAASGPKEQPDPAVRDAIERSLRSGKPEPFDKRRE